jgi:hypothetical protein
MVSVEIWRVRRLLALLAAALAVHPVVAHAQQASGVLLESDASTPARGVLVRASDVRSGRVIASARTGDDGSFRVFVGRDSTRLEALRIGSRPERLMEMRASGDVSGLSFTLRTEPIVLPPVGTVRRTRCGTTAADAARLAATLFEQARTAMALHVGADTLLRAHSRWRRIALTADGQRELANQLADSLGVARGNPLTIVTSDLFRRGFFADGGQDLEWYYAPSAEFFLDERFLEDYCLYLAGDEAGSADEIGVGFLASRRRGVSQLQGTFWFTRDGLRLTRLTFQYDGLPRDALDGAPGGWMWYEPLPDGRWVTTRWQVRMPQLGVASQGRGPGGNPSTPRFTVWRPLTGIQVHSGELLSLQSVSGDTLYAGGESSSLRP